LTQPTPEAATSRRDFLALLGACATAATAAAAAAAGDGLLSGCSKRAGAQGTATSATTISSLMPRYTPIELLKPDVPGTETTPAGYLKYPPRLVRAIATRPGTSGKTIRTMLPYWGPTPPGPGHNAYLDAVNAELGISVNPSVQDGNVYADKLSAVLAARDLPDILCTPSWEVDKIPRFSQAVKALFADLTEHLSGDAVAAYPMLGTLPTTAWQYSVWGGRLAAIPYPTDGPFPFALFYRKDLTDRAGIAAPKTIDELYAFGKKTTDPGKGVWAFGNLFDMVQMFFKCPHSKGGWRKNAAGGLEFKYEIPEYRQAIDFTARLYREGLVHPDLVASRGGDAQQLFAAGKIFAWQEGAGVWRAMQGEQARVTPGFNMQPVPVFSAIGGEPLSWANDEPIFYSFIKKGLGKERTQELLRVLDWCAAPFGSTEYQLINYGLEGVHFTRAPDGSPVPTELYRKEYAGQYSVISGRVPAVVGTADVPHYVDDSLAYFRATLQYAEPDLFKGIKVELPANYAKLATSTEDRMNDVLRGRRPLGDLDAIVKEWRRSGGDEGRAFLEKTLAANGR
jgi:putative aldouronate transport system substrate-binding protein